MFLSQVHLDLWGLCSLVSITVGYIATDKVITAKFSTKGPAITQGVCGGPTVKPLAGRTEPQGNRN